ncbi:MAG: glucose 1-dehydrogenase [Alphaproteobacteria bacterium]|nr:glucose 1-dehydrogenase [Alphaproteobacteria bacterium]
MSDTLPTTRLDGKTALVTGAGRGIGRGTALALAEAGAEVVAWSRTADEIESLVAEIDGAGGKARAQVVDVTDDMRVRQAVDELDRVDILFNNAGTNKPQEFLEVDVESLDTVLDLNIRAAFIVAQAVAARMVDQGEGAIINMSSTMGHIGGPKRAVYCTTKHAIEGLTKALACELGPKGVRVNAVAPTFIETPMTAPMLANEEFRKFVVGMIPLGKVGLPADVAGAVVFLASPAAAMINGASLLIDGGWTAH